MHKKSLLRSTRHNVLLFAALFCSSCGYQWSSQEDRPTISVPYIQGDDDGTLTAEIARLLTMEGKAKLVNHNAELRLDVKISSQQNQTVGYRKDKQKISSELKKNIVGCEGRKSLTACVTLYEGASETIVKGPYTLQVSSDYDYLDGDSIKDLAFINSEGIPTTVLPFSLGQLEPIEAAQEATTKPLYAELAQKIANVLF